MFNINQCYSSFASKPNSAYFWSGLGPTGADAAEKIARTNYGITLEMTMEQNKSAIISAGFPYNEDLGGFYWSKETASDWEIASAAFADQAQGDIHVVLGDNVREDGIWNTKELPALQANDNVTRIVSVDPSTGTEKNVLVDKSLSAKTSSSNNIVNPTATLLANNESAQTNKTEPNSRDASLADFGMSAVSQPSNNPPSSAQAVSGAMM